MSDHSERFSNGITAVFTLCVLALALGLVYAVWKYLIKPNMGLIAVTTLAICGLVVGIYVIGYVVTDLPQDIKEWWS